MTQKKRVSSRKKGSGRSGERGLRSTVAMRFLYGGIVLLFCFNGLYIYSFLERLQGNCSSPHMEGEKPDDHMESDRHEIKIEVLNGAGVSGIARTMTDYLREEGFDVINYGNAEQFTFYKTLVLDRTGGQEPAQRVARSIGTRAVLEQTNPFLAVDVTIILGRDYPGLTPFFAEGGKDE